MSDVSQCLSNMSKTWHMGRIYIYNYAFVQLLKCGCWCCSWDKNSTTVFPQKQKDYLQRIRERGHARGGRKNLDPSDETQRCMNIYSIVHAISWVWTLELIIITVNNEDHISKVLFQPLNKCQQGSKLQGYICSWSERGYFHNFFLKFLSSFQPMIS